MTDGRTGSSGKGDSVPTSPPEPIDGSVGWLHISFLAALLAYAFLFGLGDYPLLDNNEGLYAEIAREMLARGTFVIPHLNGVPYIEKPPLLYWLVSLSFVVFGETEFAARLPPALAATATCLIVFQLGARTSRPFAGWLAAVMMSSSIGFIIIGRTVYFDMLLTAFLTASLASFYRWTVDGRAIYLRISYLWLSLAVLTKGLVALAIAGPVVLVFLLVTGARPAQYLRFLDPIGLGLFLLIGLPWHAAAALQRSDFLWYYFINEHFLRYLGLREPHDYYSGPIYYYIWRIFFYLAPWSMLLPILLRWRRRAHGSGDQLSLFLWIWVAVIFVLFSLSVAKANYYMVTAAPPLALLLGQRLTPWILGPRVAPLQWFAAISVSLIAVAIGLVYGLCEPERDSLWHFCQGVSAYAAAATGGYAIAAFGLCWALRPRTIPLILSVALLVVPVLYVTLEGAKSGGQWLSQKKIVATLRPKGDDRPLFLYHDFESISSAVFYSRSRLPIIESASNDLLYGQQTMSAAGWFPSLEDFARRAPQGPVYVLMRSKLMPRFVKKFGHLDFCTVLAIGKTVVVGNTPEDCATSRSNRSDKGIRD